MILIFVIFQKRLCWKTLNKSEPSSVHCNNTMLDTRIPKVVTNAWYSPTGGPYIASSLLWLCMRCGLSCVCADQQDCVWFRKPSIWKTVPLPVWARTAGLLTEMFPLWQRILRLRHSLIALPMPSHLYFQSWLAKLPSISVFSPLRSYSVLHKLTDVNGIEAAFCFSYFPTFYILVNSRT